MNKPLQTKPKLTRAEVEQTLQQAAILGQIPDFQRVNLYGVDLTNLHLGGANLAGVDLGRANLHGANLERANLQGANLFEADLEEAHLYGANLGRANLHGATLKQANLSLAHLQQANLFEAHLGLATLEEAHLMQADLSGAYLNWANLREANLKRVNLAGASLRGTDLSYADLTDANLSRATMTQTNLIGATLNGCSIYGISAWKLKLDGTAQRDLVISSPKAPVITVDGLDLAQFITLLLNSQKVRDVVGTTGKKIVLILGQFPGERATILHELQQGVRRNGYLPLFLDVDGEDSPHLNDTLYGLAHLARFIIADITDTQNVQYALERLIPYIPSVPVQPLLQRGSREDSLLFVYRQDYPWMLDFYRYDNLIQLSNQLDAQIFLPAAEKAQKIAARRAMAVDIEARK